MLCRKHWASTRIICKELVVSKSKICKISYKKIKMRNVKQSSKKQISSTRANACKDATCSNDLISISANKYRKSCRGRWLQCLSMSWRIRRSGTLAMILTNDRSTEMPSSARFKSSAKLGVRRVSSSRQRIAKRLVTTRRSTESSRSGTD